MRKMKCKNCGLVSGQVGFPECYVDGKFFSVSHDMVDVSRTFVMGDPHGALKAIKQVLVRAKFDFNNDTLIVLGDVADGWPEVAESLEFLIDTVKNLKYVRGNHDQWLKDWLKYCEMPNMWVKQGGKNSMKSYLKNSHLIEKHKKFLSDTPFYHIDDQNRVYIHGGLVKGLPVEATDKQTIAWNRDILYDQNPYFPLYKEVFVGHTTTSLVSDELKPIQKGNVWMLDTGAGWEGKLTVMDVDTKEYWQSDLVVTLYPKSKGRND